MHSWAFTARGLTALLVSLAYLHLVAQHVKTTSSATGRVLYSETNGPARMASVMLVSVVDTSFLPEG